MPRLPQVPPPNVVGTVPLADGRRLGFADFGEPDGLPVFWLHGTPGSCRQVAPVARRTAIEQGVRLVGLARPGAGRSTPAEYQRIGDIVEDVEQVADRLGLDRFAVIGLSGGGPYTLAIGAGLPDRALGLSVLGGVAPSTGPDAAPGGVTSLAARFNGLLGPLHTPMAKGLGALLRPLIPFGDRLGDAFFSLMPPGDQAVFRQPGVKDMFIHDLGLSLIRGHGLQAAMKDALLFGREWGFRLDEVAAPVNWWHGDEDSIVPLAHGEWVAERLPDCTFHLRPGDSHLSGYAAAADVITATRAYFD